MAEFVNCDHCGTDNYWGDQVCSQCGAPLRHEFGKMAGDRVREALLPLITQAVSWPVVGVDISRYNGVMDFKKLATRAQFVIIQAGYGATGIDSAYERNLKGATEAGLVPFLYWYLKPSRDWRKTADLFAQVWKDGPKIGYAWADLEDAEGLDKSALMGWTEKFWRRFEELTGMAEKLGCYTSAGFLNRSMNMTNWLKFRPLWAAHWTTAPSPVLPNEWTAIHNPKTWMIWQHQVYKPGADYGSGSGAIDLNRFNGSVAAFNALFGTNIKPLGEVPTPEPPPTPEPEPTRLQMVVLQDGLRVRDKPSVDGNQVGRLAAGAKVNVLNVDGKDCWVEIEPGKWANVRQQEDRNMRRA